MGSQSGTDTPDTEYAEALRSFIPPSQRSNETRASRSQENYIPSESPKADPDGGWREATDDLCVSKPKLSRQLHRKLLVNGAFTTL